MKYFFPFRLPKELSTVWPKDALNAFSSEDQIYREIQTAIANVYGIRGTSHKPFMVIECMINTIIKRFEEPISNCVTLVINELKMAAEKFTDCVSNLSICHNVRF